MVWGCLVAVVEVGCSWLDFRLLTAEEAEEAGWMEVAGVEKAVEDVVTPGEGERPKEPDIVWTGDKTYSMRSLLSPLLVSNRPCGLWPS